ncbi:transglutaminase-like domain-containing protein [Novosphingobium pentaromativorans]|uniref:Transglutaminase-like protein n=1 Tax=Novosphingobium pentaromativorans US6-1 TaxID=1088721 RepID=G6ED09_9SPHN|nr:transglutaminase family protein [Novosphingobium pentaromativorans]AIT79886.1 transglutaminase [Novosphingobium pentaromativorans US6-1]EHJ60848.1 transglutaminase-like protein [Novosphingobium pentaromativorans US6-1]
MKLSIRTELDYSLPAPADVLLQIEAAILPEQKVLRAHIDLPPVEHFARIPGHDNIGDRIWLAAAETLKVHYEATVEPVRMLARVDDLAAVPAHLLPGETVDYLMPSRYCPSDTFQNLVEAEFGGLQGGARVGAIRDWIGQHLTYVVGSSESSTCAEQTFVTRQGVCRDFAHLMITLTRASAIPARFASVYGLGVDPQDFHAVAEVFLDGAWHMVDATGMSRPECIAKIGVGRDAADVSFLTSYGAVTLNSQSVEVTEVA